MRIVPRLCVSLFCVGVLFAVQASALSKQVAQLVHWETKSNNRYVRSEEEFKIKHFEIPLRLLEKNMSPDAPGQLNQSLFFEKNGETYVRWIINPEDTRWYLEVEKFLKDNNVDTTTHEYFLAHLTASRSIILEDPNSGYTFSAKVSTDHTGGKWTEKKMYYKDAVDIRKISDLVRERVATNYTENIVPLYEPLLLGIPSLDQGMMIRDLGELNEGKVYYLPAFAALAQSVGVDIAKQNGSDKPVAFWNEHYMKSIGKALAQYASAMGATYDSPHSQNFLIELDENMKPTGRIVLRDLADIYLMKEFYTNINRQDLIESYTKERNVQAGRIPVIFGPLQGGHAPSWINYRSYDFWLESFFESFNQEFSRITNIPLAELTESKLSLDTYGDGSRELKTTSEAWRRFFESATKDCESSLLNSSIY